MLSWANPLSIHELYDGLDRRFKFRQLPKLPPIEVVNSLIDKFSEFRHIDETLIYDTDPATPDKETILGKIASLLSEADGNVLHRSVIFSKLREQDELTASTSIYLQFGEVITSTGFGCVRLIGSDPSLTQIHNARSYGLAKSKKGLLEITYSPNEISLKATLGNNSLDTGTISIPKKVAIILGDRKFPTSSPSGKNGKLARSNLAIFGLSPILSSMNVVPGEEIEIKFNLEESTARVDFVNDITH